MAWSKSRSSSGMQLAAMVVFAVLGIVLAMLGVIARTGAGPMGMG